MKKQWISVKCGLSRDPKHRQAMGESIWLFLHILDITSWDDGIAHDWKDEAEAEEMGMPVRTLREHRRKLDELGYITCNQKQYTQDIVVHNWTNPREYNGSVYNKKQGGREKEPHKNAQGDTQGYIQGNRKDVTPTYDSNIKESNGDKSPLKTDELPIEWQIMAGVENITPPDNTQALRRDAANLIAMTFGANAQQAFDLVMAFQNERGITFTESDIKGQRKAVKALLEKNVKPNHVQQAVEKLLAGKMTISDLFGIVKTAIDLATPKEMELEKVRLL